MKNSDYWKERFNILEAAKNNAGERTIADIEDMFYSAQRELESQIQTWYGRFAKNNQISLAEAKRLLNTRELAEFRWDVNEYIKYGKQVGLNPAWMKQLENASARFHVSRLEALQLQTQQTMEKLFGNQLDTVDRLMKQQYLDGYYHTFYEVQKGYNIGWDIAAVNEGKLKRVLSKPWTIDDKTFSNRIWDDKNKLLNHVHTELTRNMILGKSPDAAINNLAKAMGTSKSNAGRLIMTESAYFSNLAQRDAFIELDVERFEVVETLDRHTCAVCGAMDGRVFPMSDYQAGTTAPPFHPWCRGCTAPHFDDDIGKRAAKNADGKTYYVPSDMKYEEWKAKYVDKTQPPRTASNKKNDDDLKKNDDTDIIGSTKFISAKTIIEAEEFAFNKLNIAADYQKYNINVANAVNETIINMRDIFGSNCFEDGLHIIGTFPKGYSTRWSGAFAWHPKTETGDLWLRNVSSNNALEKLSSVAQVQYNAGFWSTGDALHTVRHELGHAVVRSAKQRKVQGTMLEEINALKNKIQTDVFQAKGGTAMYSQFLSKYGFTNTSEFIAESVAEYMAGNPRETATEVVEIMIKHMNGGD